MWKKNMIENLENGNLSYIIVREFLSDLNEEFRGGDNKTMKMVKLKKVKQRSRTIKKFVQKFKRVARNNRYERRLLVKEFKKRINRVIKIKLIKVEYSLRSIKQ